VTSLIALFLAPLTILTFCFAVEVFAGLRPLRRRHSSAVAGDVVIVVPAHDEEAILEARLKSLCDAAGASARILVVADNCSDSTADIARACGVEVIERADADNRGKGFALDFARRHLRGAPPDIVIVMDADCSTDRAGIDSLINACALSANPCQATYLFLPVSDASPTVQLSNFAFYVRNAVRQRGLQRLARRVHLVGTGMAFPWVLFDRPALATSNLVEDLELGLELAAAGHPPLFVPDATVWSDAATQRDTFHQRRRWEGGYLRSAARWVPRLLAQGLRDGNIRDLWAGISLLIPPFALLLILDFACLFLAGLATRISGASDWPVMMAAGALLTASFGLILAWVTGGSRFVSAASLAKAPLYVFWKLPLYLGLARRGAPKEWLRTGR